MIIDFSQWEKYDGFSEGSGRSEKIWLTNPETAEIGLFKFPKPGEPTEHVSESLASKIAKLLEIDCAKVDIGTYHGRIGSMSYLVIQEDKYEMLSEGINFITLLYPTYNPATLYDQENDVYYSLSMISKVMDELDKFNDFLKIPLFDFLIGNSDRHHSNWALILDKAQEVSDILLQNKLNARISPLYDNGSSLCCFVNEENIDGFLGNDQVRFRSLVDSKSKSMIRIDEKKLKRPTHLEVVKYIKKNHEECLLDFLHKVNNKITEENIDKLLEEYPDKILSKKRKKLIKLFLLAKVELINNI